MALVFTLTKQAAKIAHINLRIEMHGEEELAGMDIKVQADVPNDFLSYLSSTLKWSLYDKPDKQAELIEDKGHLPRLRYSELGEMHWAGEMDHAVFVVHGAKKSEDLQLEGEVDKVRIECKDGGTVALTFRVKVLPTPAQTGALSGLLGKDVRVSVGKQDEGE